MNIVYFLFGILVYLGQLLGILYIFGLFKKLPIWLKIVAGISQCLILIACIRLSFLYS